MRPSGVFLTIGVLGFGACSHATAPTRQGAAPSPARQDTSRATNGAGQTAGRQQAPDASAPKPYNQVITAGAATQSGGFTAYPLGGKKFYENPQTTFRRGGLLVPRQPGPHRGAGVP